MSEPLQASGPGSTVPERSRRGRRLAVTTLAVVGIVGTGVGAGVAVADRGSPPAVTTPAMSTHPTSPDRQSWAHRYGLDRATMANLPDVAAASPEQRAAATDLLVRTEAASAPYADPAKAAAAGFDLQAGIVRAEKKRPGLADALQRIDAGHPAPGGRMPMVHVPDKANRADGKVLDPAAPETLMYGYRGHGQWTLVGVMYTANEAYPQAPPDPGGPITRWHYHAMSGGQNLMMHIFFAPGNELSQAYATDMKG
jgi:hypothetical protein